MKHRGVGAEWTAEGLALHIQAVLQGAFILARTRAGGEDAAAVAAISGDHLRRYVAFLFHAAHLA